MVNENDFEKERMKMDGNFSHYIKSLNLLPVLQTFSK
jgi:hypothetical protein